MFDVSSPKGPTVPELIPGGAWFNSDPLLLYGLFLMNVKQSR